MAYTTIDNPELYFQTKTYSGSSSDVTVTFDGSEDMQPDLVWLKKTSGSGDHLIYDSVRGTNKRLQPNATDAEVDRSSDNDELKSFNSDGWTLGTFNSNVTGAGSTNVSWNWKAGTTSGITTNGSTTITPAGYSFSATSGVSIVKYAGNGTTGAKYPHGLGVTPKMVIVKNLGTTDWWNVHHTSLGNNSEMYLNTTDAAPGSTGNGTTPDSVNIDLEGTGTAHNGSSNNYIAYVFADVQGYSKFGSYTGNGNADGTFVYTGFRPAWVITKRTDTTSDWYLSDNKRNGYNGSNEVLYANESDAEKTVDRIDILSNGFKLRSTGSGVNASGGTFVYMAFAEAPFVNSNGVPCNAR
jgi:hypothetical protein